MSTRLRLLLISCCFAASATWAAKPKFDPMNPDPSLLAPKPVPAAKPAAPTVKPAAPAAKPAGAAQAKPAAGGAKPLVDPLTASIPRVVPYEELERHVGKFIIIKTNLRTQRKGVLKRFNRAGLQIEDTSRGFAMNIDIPRSTVAEVSVKE
jgi:hypothetical protein